MAKFCTNCGAQMNDSAKVCGMCGTPFPRQTYSPDFSVTRTNTVPRGVPSASSRPNISKAVNTNANQSILQIINAVLFILVGIFGFFKLINVSFDGDKIKELSLFDLYEGGEVIPIVLIILLFASALLTAIQFLGITKGKKFTFQVVISILNFVFIILTYIIEASINPNYGVYFNFCGWLYLIVSIAIVVLSVYVKKLKKKN